MKFKIKEQVVFVDKRRSSKIQTVEGDTNWRPNHILLSNDNDASLEPVHENDVRLATQNEIAIGIRQ